MARTNFPEWRPERKPPNAATMATVRHVISSRELFRLCASRETEKQIADVLFSADCWKYKAHDVDIPRAASLIHLATRRVPSCEELGQMAEQEGD